MSLAAAAGTALLLAACGSSSTASSAAPASPGTDSAAASSPASSAAAAASGATLTIAGFAFSPLTVKAGETVTVVNSDSADHTVTAADAGIDVKVPAGGSTTFTAPTKPGTYVLTCDFHPSMQGTMTVTA
ncbi:MAG: cupredoxin domain-containing protein [Candidatus Nanopelagicales bacterium]